MRPLIWISLLMMSVGLSSCGNFLQYKEDPASGPMPTFDRLDFGAMSAQIFLPRCVSCHDHYRNYESVRLELPAILDAIDSGRMPKRARPLSPVLRSLIREWVSRGAPERDNIVVPPPTPRPLRPSWASLGPRLFTPKCRICHNPTGQAKFLDLSEWESLARAKDQVFEQDQKLIDTVTPEKSYLISLVQDELEPMPPPESRIPRLTSEEISVLLEWIRLGIPRDDPT